jgi:hypothetical protein
MTHFVIGYLRDPSGRILPVGPERLQEAESPLAAMIRHSQQTFDCCDTAWREFASLTDIQSGNTVRWFVADLPSLPKSRASKGIQLAELAVAYRNLDVARCVLAFAGNRSRKTPSGARSGAAQPA